MCVRLILTTEVDGEAVAVNEEAPADIGFAFEPPVMIQAPLAGPVVPLGTPVPYGYMHIPVHAFSSIAYLVTVSLLVQLRLLSYNRLSSL